MSNIIRVVSAVVDTRNLTLYKEDFSTVVIPQGDVRVRPIVEYIIPLLMTQPYADVDISEKEENAYLEFEGKSLVRFFRVAKSKLQLLLNISEDVQMAPTVPNMSIGNVPAQTSQTMDAVNEILAHAVPAASPDFNSGTVAKQRNITENGQTPNDHPDQSHPDTVIAVVDNKIVPGMELIQSQFARAAKLGSTVGVERFLQRLASVIEKRSHSVEDLLKFLERGDLPIADDGTIVIYKVLRNTNNAKDEYVDCHTGKVQQRIGDYVCMDESLVDHNRNNECSNGLHVARRGYVGSFSGTACVIAKLKPEDVIAVPTYDANKMRVCGYHIIDELSLAQYNLVKANRPITEDAPGKVLLGNVLAGNHPSSMREVRITEQHGGGVKYKTLHAEPAATTTDDIKEAEALHDEVKQVDKPLVPKDAAAQVKEMTRKELIQKLYKEHLQGDPNALMELLGLKKQSKTTWEKMGIPDPTVAAPKPSPAKITAPVKANFPAAKVLAAANEGSPRERIQKLLQIGLNKDIAEKIYTIKKQSKKSWEALNVSPDGAAQILDLVNK